MYKPQFLQQIREFEAQRVLSLLPAGGKLLEIGAGAGWQAKWFAERGYDVSAVDIVSPKYNWQPVYPVTAYDGVHLPFPDGAFDIVFSSNVLEHVQQLPELLQETFRVLRSDGVAVHVLPTGSWRFWSSLTHYSDLWRRLGESFTRKNLSLVRRLRHFLAVLWYEGVPPRHGEKGNVFSEIYWFSRFRWRAEFERAGWRLMAQAPNGLFYTGSSFLGEWISIAARQPLSRCIGSSCFVYVLQKPSQG